MLVPVSISLRVEFAFVCAGLIGTVSEVAGNTDITSHTRFESVAMRNLLCVFGSKAIAEELRGALAEHKSSGGAAMALAGLSQDFNLSSQFVTYMRTLASTASFLSEDTKSSEQPSSFVIRSVKEQLYRKVCLCIDGAAYYLGLSNSETTSTWQKLGVLYQRGFLHRLYYIAVKRYLNLVYLLRVLTQLIAKCERELIHIAASDFTLPQLNTLHFSRESKLFEALVQYHFPVWSQPEGLLALFCQAMESFSKFSGLPSDNLCLYRTDIIGDLVWNAKLNLFSKKLSGAEHTTAMQAVTSSVSDASPSFLGMRIETGTRLLHDFAVSQLFVKNSKGEVIAKRTNQAGNGMYSIRSLSWAKCWAYV